MTEEQIKSLDIGDKFIVEYEVVDTCSENVIVKIRDDKYRSVLGWKHAVLETAALVTPSPTFELGDTVRIIRDPKTGTAYNGQYRINEYVGKKGIVAGSLSADGNLYVDMGDVEDNGYIAANVHCLELVKKAVKDKYRVVPTKDRAWWIIDSTLQCTIVEYWAGHPSAKDAADAECARLNSEWIKQQEGGEA